MRRLIARILSHHCFVEAPPVLVDIGASGSLPALWRPLAPYSLGIAFDADAREFTVNTSQNAEWKQLYSFNRLVAPVSSHVDFYLTKSPFCSSSLRPDSEALRPWAFRSLFDVEDIVQLPALDLRAALNTVGISRIDWFKCDSQGTDLRLFTSLPSDVADKVLAADFEPGIIDAYVGEDKLHQLMAHMDQRPFWVSDMVIHGSHRIDGASFERLNYFQRRSLESFLRISPGWCEITYLNKCESEAMTSRDLLLAWIFASLKKQHGFAMELASRGQARFGEPIFDQLWQYSKRQLGAGYPRFAVKALKRLLRTLRILPSV